jgi:hypothetical protein
MRDLPSARGPVRPGGREYMPSVCNGGMPAHTSTCRMSIVDLVAQAKLDAAYVVGNRSKGERESWVVRRWLLARGVISASVIAGDDPPDFVIDGVEVEVVETLEAHRKRGDDYAGRVAAAKEGRASFRKLPSLSVVRALGHEWIHASIAKKCIKNYDSSAASHWSLLVYVNFSWADQVQWYLLENELAVETPVFASIEALYEGGAGPVARRLFQRR